APKAVIPRAAVELGRHPDSPVHHDGVVPGPGADVDTGDGSVAAQHLAAEAHADGPRVRRGYDPNAVRPGGALDAQGIADDCGAGGRAEGRRRGQGQPWLERFEARSHSAAM